MPSGGVVESLGIPVIDKGKSPQGEGAVAKKAGTAASTPAVKDPATSESAPTTEKPGATTPPLVLGESLPAVPAKLVAKILKGEYVDMAELLKDNIEVGRRKDLQDGARGSGCSGGNKASRREVPDLLSWVQCFGVYAAVLASKFPEKARELWAYQVLIVKEARRCGGTGWKEYDSMFRQQASSAVQLEWTKLNSSLFSVTFLTQSGRGKNCSLCQESDHASAECALATPAVAPLGVQGEPRERRLTSSQDRPWRPKSDRVCYSWNEGRCSHAPYCRFRHVCAGCQGEHKVSDCRRQGRAGRPRDGSGGRREL